MCNLFPIHLWQESSGNVDHFVALERLKVRNTKVESIRRLNEVSERQMNLGLQNIELYTLPIMTCLFKGLKKSFSLKKNYNDSSKNNTTSSQTIDDSSN